ncbi:hypothetical protein PENCOP_c002G07623 [Penicillium coprophilum]|uniref:Uncharacterized protein n=1 Tax=Penicillium coprophilum TaxID=36646 RepID=A0A1V6V1G1_9EURO|nr:hypothetical protein PENCOP_c002G07623 [Penicillium coprophilum]
MSDTDLTLSVLVHPLPLFELPEPVLFVTVTKDMGCIYVYQHNTLIPRFENPSQKTPVKAIALEIPSDVLFKPLWAAHEPMNVLRFAGFHHHRQVLELKFAWISQILAKALMPAPGTMRLRKFTRRETYGLYA